MNCPKRALTCMILLGLGLSSARAQHTAFTYQGYLTGEGGSAQGDFQLRFSVHDAPVGGSQVGGPITLSPVHLTNGAFTVTLDFGPGVFTGRPCWLGIEVATNGLEEFVALRPRQALTPTPYALYATRAGSASGALGGSGTVGGIPRFTDSLTLGDSMVRQAGDKIGVGPGLPEQALDVSGGDLQVRGAGGFDAVGEQATLFLGDGNHLIQGIYGTGVVVRTWAGEKLFVDRGDLLVRGADQFAGPGNAATAFLGDTVHYVRATREFGMTLGIWPVGDLVCLREPLGRVGIGTTQPEQKLDVNGGHLQVRGPGSFDASGEQATVFLGDGNHFIQGIYGMGVKIGTWAGEKVDVDRGDLLVRGPDNFAAGGSLATVYLGDTVHYLRARREYGLALGTWPVGDVLTVREPTGWVGIGTANPTSRLTVRGNIAVQSAATGDTVVELGEGLDYAEGFDVADRDEVTPGMVLVIDAEHPGQLALSRKAYDRKVAGIVAGARGLGSGVRLGADRFDHPVALAGRVYCNVDATFGAIEPGDLLTTSPTPGHAMVVKDPLRAAGAILGKAMESLAEGVRGPVLVLVTLQ